MSDTEEPPKKITKYEMESQYLEGEVMDEGQEEWLSEGILTDDDYNPAAEHERSDSNLGNTSQEETVMSANEESIERLETESQDASYEEIQNISQQNDVQDKSLESEHVEDTHNSLDDSKSNIENDLPEELNAFLIRKKDGKVLTPAPPTVVKDKESDVDESAKQSEDDGNDTDDLLRMLGGEDQKNKALTRIDKKNKVSFKNDSKNKNSSEDEKKTMGLNSNVKKTKGLSADDKKIKGLNVVHKKKVLSEDVKTEEKVKKEEPASSDDDDDYIFENRKAKTVKFATSILRKQLVGKAEPEDDVTDPSSDEAITVKRMFGVQGNRAAKLPKKANVRVTRSNTKSEGKVEEKHNASQPKIVIDRMAPNIIRKIVPVQSPSQKRVEQPKLSSPIKQYTRKRPQPSKPVKSVKNTSKPEPDENEGLEDDLDDEFTERTKSLTNIQVDKLASQRIMQPERMDEEVPTDADSDSGDESLYDELPSSDSENMDDWFTLDIRAENAGNYIPLLGEKAFKLLTEEKERVTGRLSSLKKNLTVLTENGKRQAEQLRKATITLAELDTLLKTT